MLVNIVVVVPLCTYFMIFVHAFLMTEKIEEVFFIYMSVRVSVFERVIVTESCRISSDLM